MFASPLLGDMPASCRHDTGNWATHATVAIGPRQMRRIFLFFFVVFLVGAARRGRLEFFFPEPLQPRHHQTAQTACGQLSPLFQAIDANVECLQKKS